MALPSGMIHESILVSLQPWIEQKEVHGQGALAIVLCEIAARRVR